MKRPLAQVAPPRRQDLARHQDNGQYCPCHCRHKRNIDRSEEQAAIDVAGHQAQEDGDQTRPPAEGEPAHREGRGYARQSQNKCCGMADREPVGELERLQIRDEDLKPGAVIPERSFDLFEMGASVNPLVYQASAFGP